MKLRVGGFCDILHDGHRYFFRNVIDSFIVRYKKLPDLMMVLNTDEFAKRKKGSQRPIFPYSWRKQDLDTFFKKLIAEGLIASYEIRPEWRSFSDPELILELKDLIHQEGMVFGIQKDHKAISNLLNLGADVITFSETDFLHTSDIFKILLDTAEQSFCNVKKVGALVLTQGHIIAKGYNCKLDNCADCPRYHHDLAQQPYSDRPRCYRFHAEENALKGFQNFKGADLLVTEAPCMNCAELIVQKGIARVSFLNYSGSGRVLKYLAKNEVQTHQMGGLSE